MHFWAHRARNCKDSATSRHRADTTDTLESTHGRGGCSITHEHTHFVVASSVWILAICSRNERQGCTGLFTMVHAKWDLQCSSVSLKTSLKPYSADPVTFYLRGRRESALIRHIPGLIAINASILSVTCKSMLYVAQPCASGSSLLPLWGTRG